MTNTLSHTETVPPEEPIDPRVENLVEQRGLSSFAGRAAMDGVWPKRPQHVRGRPRYGVAREVGDHAAMVNAELVPAREAIDRIVVPDGPGHDAAMEMAAAIRAKDWDRVRELTESLSPEQPEDSQVE